MKKVFIGVLLLIVIFACMPIINGIITKGVVDRAMVNVNSIYSDTGMDYSLEIVSYKRGWLSSEIEWKINLGKLKSVYGIDEIRVSEQTKHGYTSVVSTSSLDKNEWFTKIVSEQLGGNNPFQITTSYSLLGEIKSIVAFDAFSLTVEEEIIDIHPGNFVIATDTSLRNFISSGSWQGLKVVDKISIGEMNIESDLEMISSFLWDGDMKYELKNMTITEGFQDFEISDLTGTYVVDVDIAKNRMDIETFITANNLNAGGTLIDNPSARFIIKAIDAHGYEDFMKQYTQLASEIIGSIGELEDDQEGTKEILEQQMRASAFQIMAAYESLLKKDLEIQIKDVLVKLAEGDIKADVSLRLLKDMTFTQFAPIMGQPDLLFDILYAKSDVSLPANLVEGTPMLLEPLYPGMQTGVFVSDGTMLTHKGETKDGKLFINDQEVILTQ